MDFNALIAELRASSENLPKDSVDRSLLSSVYCNKACKVLDQIADNTDYDNIITGLWLVAAHFAEQLVYLKPVPALSELCFKLFRQCAKAVLNIQWQNLDEESSLRQNFLASLANLHAKLVPLDFPRFCLLETLTANPWTNPTLAKVMGGEVEESDKEEVRSYIEQEDPIILQLRVDMMLKENCEEYALNLCNSCLSHPELQSDLGVRKTQLSLLYKLGQEDKLQEECQKLNIQDAVRIIKQLQTSETHRQICTVLAQTFMVQNWIRPSDMEANKELLRLWIRHQLLVDREQDQFKESVWAMAKLSQSTEQIVIFIDVLREECGETYLQLYVDMCIFAINVDKGQMETNKKEGNMEAAAARRSDMASICAKLSCLCHHASLKVARICALTSFALKPTEQSFAKIGTFYGQGTDCCKKCGVNRNREPGTVNPATLYEVERLLNMLRPDYLSPDQSYANIQILCRRFLQESLKNAQQVQRGQILSQNSGASITIHPNISGNALTSVTSHRPTNVFEALSPQDYQNTQILLNRLRLQTVTTTKISIPSSLTPQSLYQSNTNRPNILQQSPQSSSQQAGQGNKPQYVFDIEKIKSKQPYGVPVEQQHQYYLIKHEKELEQRRKNAQKKRDEKTQQNVNVNSQMQQQISQLLQQQQFPKQQQNIEVTQIIQTALKRDSQALQKLTQGASPGVVQAVLNMMKGTVLKSSQLSTLQSQQSSSQLVKPMVSSPLQGTQPLPTVSTLLKPSAPIQQLQKQPQPKQPREQSPPRRYPRPQLYAQPIIVSTSSSVNPLGYQPNMLNSRNHAAQNSTAMSPSSIGEKQKAENFMLAKSHVEDIRRFMQMQMSNLQQKQISENHQMSGSTIVNLSNASMANKPDPATFNLMNRPKTTVELAEQAALAKLQKQDSTKPSIYQQAQHLKGNNEQMFTSGQGQTMTKSKQQFITTSSRPDSGIDLQQHQQQKLLHLQQQQQQNNAFSYQSNQSSSSSSVLPSSDELSGSIMGVDDTIIKELLQDSGLLANTFPDIEVDTIGDDKSRKVPDQFMLPQSSTPPSCNQLPKSSKHHLYTYSMPRAPQATYLPQRLSASQPSRSNSMTIIRQTQNVSGSSVQPPVSSTNRYSTLPSTTTGSLSTMSQPNLNKPLDPNTFSGYSNQIPSSQQLRTNTKFTVSVPPRDSISVFPKKDIKQECKPTVDQLREMMKREDIQGEIYMDAANNATYRCIICSFAFETLDHLREHVRNVCKPGLQSSSVYNTKIKQDRANSAKAGVETTTVFQCLRCFELCVSDAGIKQHRLTCKRVPTVPSDLKKEAAVIKQKVPPKITVTKQPQKKEPQDNSHKIPELPLPFPYPSLNAEAVFKSMSMTGSQFHQSHTPTPGSNKPQNPSVAREVVNMSTSPVPPSLPGNTSKTITIHPIKVSVSASSSHTNSPLIKTGSLSMNSPKTPIISPIVTSSVPTKDLHVPPQIKTPSTEPTGATVNVLKEDPILKEVEKPTVKINPEPPPQPRFTEITGSGGSKFFKCAICSQTLCSFESFLVHWNECAMKNKHLVRRLEWQDKPVTAEVIEKLLTVLADVAAGSGTIPETIIVDPEWNDLDEMYSLRDPCKDGSPDISDSSEDSVSWYETECSENQESMSDSIADEEKKTGGGMNDEVRYKGRKSGHDMDHEDGEHEDNEKTLKKVKKKYSEDFDDDSSRTESEQSYMSTKEQDYVSTREDLPKLRDRKTLKPIHSFINESFNSSISRTVVKSTKLDDISKEMTEEEEEDENSSESEVDSDGDSLYCKICQTSYQTKRILLQHFAGKHLQPYTVKTVADSSSYFCHLCQKTFSTFMHYMQHVPNHSVTIYEKMKAFINSKKSSQRSERIASQRGLSKKGNIIPKISKELKNKKGGQRSELDRLQLLAGKTQLVRERLRISKRKRSLQSTFTSSEDDYSSDASNNVVFKSKKSTENESSNEQKPVTRSRNARPMRQSSQPQANEDDSSANQSGEDSDHGPKLAQDRDDDYVLSDDYDSDGINTNTPPATRSRQRITLSLRSSDTKRRKPSHDLELNEGGVSENKNNTENCRRYLYNTDFQDFDEDSNSSVLILSQGLNGKFVPYNDKVETLSGSGDTSNTKEAEKDKLKSSCVLIVRSLGRRQKELLTSCDLQPTVVLKTLSLDDSDKHHKHEILSSKTTPDQSANTSLNKNHENSQDLHMSCTSSEVSKSEPVKSSSFLDSFLSYLNQYPLSGETGQPGRKRNKSGPPRERESKKRRGSLDACQASDKNQSPSFVSHTSSSELEAPERVDESEVKTPNSSLDSTVQDVALKFPTRPCSVNLGQKLSLKDLQANKDILSISQITIQDKTNPSVAVSTGDQERLEVLDKTQKTLTSSGAIAEKTQIPVSSLERSGKVDKLTTRPTTPEIPTLNEKNYNSQAETKEVNNKKQRNRSLSEDTDRVQTNRELHNCLSVVGTDNGSFHSLSDSETQPSIITTDLYSEQLNSVFTTESTDNTCTSLVTAVDCTPQTGTTECFQPKQGKADLTVAQGSPFVEENKLANLSSFCDGSFVLSTSKQADSEAPSHLIGYSKELHGTASKVLNKSDYSCQGSKIDNVNEKVGVCVSEKKFIQQGIEVQKLSVSFNNDNKTLIAEPHVNSTANRPITSCLSGDCPDSKSRVTGDFPDSKLIYDCPNSKVTNDFPDTKVTDDCYNSMVTNDCPDSKVTNDCPDSKVADDCPDYKVTDDCPDYQSGVIEDRPVSMSRVTEDCLDFKITEDCLQSQSRGTEDCSESVSRISEPDPTKLSVATQNREVKGTRVIMMSCTAETRLDKAGHFDDFVFAEIGQLQNPQKYDLQKGVTFSPGQHDAVGNKNSRFQNGTSQHQSEKAEIQQKVREHKLIDAAESEKSRTQDITKIVYQELREEASCDVPVGKSMSQNMLQSAICLATEDISEERKVCNRVNLGSSVSDADIIVSEGIHNQCFTSIPVKCVKDDKACGELSSTKYTTENIAYDETIMDTDKCAKAPSSQNSISENDSIEEMFGNESRSRLKQPSISKDKTDIQDSLLINPQSKVYKEKSVPVCTNVKGVKFETDIKCSPSLDQQSKTCKEKSVKDCGNVEAHKQDETSKQNAALSKKVDSYKESIQSSKPNKTARKQDKKGKAILNPNISLAAFIAERLTKDDLESSRRSRTSNTKKVCVRQVNEDSPLDIGCHIKESMKPVFIRSSDSMSPGSDHHPLDHGKLVQRGHEKSTHEQSAHTCHEKSSHAGHEKSMHEESVLTGHEKPGHSSHEKSTHEAPGPCSGLVDYSSSDGEDDCCRLNDDEACSKEVFPVRDEGALPDIQGQSKDQIDTGNQDKGFLVSAEPTDKVGPHPPASSSPAEKSDEHCHVQVELGIGLVLEKMIESNAPVLQEHHEQTQGNGIHDVDLSVRDKNNRHIDTAGECSEKVHKSGPGLIYQFILGEVDKNQSLNTNLDRPCLLGSESSKKISLNVNNENKSRDVLVTRGGESERKPQCISDENRIVNDSNEEKQSYKLNMEDNVKTLSSLTNELDNQHKSTSLEELVQNCEVKAVMVKETNTCYSSHIDVYERMTENTSCGEVSAVTSSSVEMVQTDDDDVGFWKAPNELLEANDNIKYGACPMTASMGLDESCPLTYCKQPEDTEDSQSLSQTHGKMWEGSVPHSGAHQTCEQNVAAVVLSLTDHRQGLMKGKESSMASCLHIDIYEEEVHLLSPVYTHQIAEDEESSTASPHSATEACVSNFVITDDKQTSSKPEIPNKITRKLLQHFCDEKSQISGPHSMSVPSVQDCLPTDSMPDVPVLGGNEENILHPSEQETHKDLSSGKNSGKVSPKLAHSFIVGAAGEITSGDLTSTPETTKHVQSRQSPSDSDKDISLECTSSCNYVENVFSVNDETDKDTTNSTEKQQLLDKSANREEHLKRDSNILESLCAFADCQTQDDKSKECLGEMYVLRHAITPENTKTGQSLMHHMSSNTSDYSNSESKVRIGERSSASSNKSGSTKLSAGTTSQSHGLEDSATLDGSRTSSESRTSDPPGNSYDRQNTDHETDDGDDLSDFDLVIENDTSYRSLSFPITLEKKSYSNVPSQSSNSYTTKGKINYLSSNSSTGMGCLAYNKLLTSEDSESPFGPKLNKAVGKTLATSRSFKKSNQERFVWDIDDDNDGCKNPLSAASQTVSSTPSFTIKKASAIETVSNPALDALKRKQKALREKSETTPFTWDLEDLSDNSASNSRNTPTVQSSTKTSRDIPSFTSASQGRNQDVAVSKAHKRITQRKRPLTPDFPPGKVPAKLRRTSSVEGHAKSGSAPVGRGDKKDKLVAKCDVGEGSSDCLSVDPAESSSNNSITVDEEISFKKDSFSSPDGLILTEGQIFHLGSLGSQGTKLKRERSNKHSKLTLQTAFGHQDDRSDSSSHADEEEFKNQGLRSRHSSMESNKSDKSFTTKRAADGLPQVSNKRPKKNEDSITPKLKKIGLIKVNKDSLNPPASSGTDSTVPLTRSSEAAIKAFYQKSLRSRGVNLVHTSHSPQPTVSKNVSPNVHLKTTAEASSRLKVAVSVHKVSPLSTNTVRNSSSETKSDMSHNLSSRKSHSSISDTAAVVKRRSPLSGQISQSPRVIHAKKPVAIKSKKSVSGHSKTPHATARTTIFRVDPLPGTAVVSKGACRSPMAPSAKGTRTLHTPLPPGTNAFRPDNDTSKQPKWKIKKETKLCRGKKQQKGPLSFKRT